MRSLVFVVALIVAAGVFVARMADRAIVDMQGRQSESGGATRSTPPVTFVVPRQDQPPTITARAPEQRPAEQPRNKLPQVIKLAPSANSEPEYPSQSSSGYRTVTVRGDSRGHFKVEARVDGRRMSFLVDTGASAVAIRASDAAMLGIHPSENDYNVRTQTANGTGRAARARIAMIEIENIVVRDVVALVHPDDLLRENLLGMTFLSKIRFSYDRGQLVLDQ